MSNTNDFLPFAYTDTGTNLVEQAAYVTDTRRPAGNVPGIASSALNNKAIRQCTYMVSQIAQYISNALTQDVLDNATPSTLLGQIQNALGTPSGVIQAYGAATAPTGWLNCDGSTYLETSYPNLFAAIGTTYNTGGEASGYFRVPDLRGIFVRGAGSNGHLTNADGAAYSDTLGTYQTDQMQGHYHQNSGGTSANIVGVGGSGSPGVQIGGGGFSYLEVTSPMTDGTNGAPRTGVETRPASLGLNYIIRT